jgi:hypothetical protein
MTPIDYSKYPPNWKEVSKRIRFERAKESGCEFCGAQNGQTHPTTGTFTVLTVAHLNHDPWDCRDENLAALCQTCHLRYDAPEKGARRRYGKNYRGPQQGTLTFRESHDPRQGEGA